MSNFHNLAETLTVMAKAAAPGVAAVRPLTIGDGVMAGLLRTGKHNGGLHSQPHHEELLVVVEGEAEFRVGDETRRVRAGDYVFVPRNTIHGTVATIAEPLSFLSIIAPRIDLERDVTWQGERPRFQMV
jgi:mannose-6-phosphate isomerase-like protein (cupin superfamily)